MTFFSLLMTILCIIFLVGEVTYLHFTIYKNRRFMFSFDACRPALDEFTITTIDILKFDHDIMFCFCSALLIALIPNQVQVLCRALIKLKTVYILNVVVQIRTQSINTYKLCYYGKLIWTGIFIFLMILLIDFDVNVGLGNVGKQGISFHSLILFITSFQIVFAVMLYRWFNGEK